MAWDPKLLNQLRGPDAAVLRKILLDLAQFLEEPTFENGVFLGDGVRTYNATLGLSGQVETHKVIVDSTTDALDVL